MRKLLSLCLLVLISFQLLAEPLFLSRSIQVENKEYRYRVFLPQAWQAITSWPVILFLHGAGERGADNSLHTSVGIGPALKKQPDLVPAIVVMPQCASDQWWSDPAMEKLALASLAQAIQEFKGDPARQYLTGLSMGGYASWHLASKYPQRFLAVAPVAARLRPPSGVAAAPDSLAAEADVDIYRATAEHTKHLPLWVFHGAKDPVVPVSESRQVVAVLNALSAEVQYQEFATGEHNIWDEVYGNKELYQWMLSYQ